MRRNVGHEFDRLPTTDAEREVEGRPTRTAVVDWWVDRFGVPSSVFDHYTFWENGSEIPNNFYNISRAEAYRRFPELIGFKYTFWEKGKGKVWALPFDLEPPVPVESLGMKFIRTRQEHWKPTTDAVQRFGRHATRNVIDLDPDDARAFVAGETTEPAWDGDWGYLVVRHEIADAPEPIGVGLYVHHELRSMVPKGRQREF